MRWRRGWPIPRAPSDERGAAGTEDDGGKDAVNLIPLLDDRLAIVGVAGSGKTYCAKGMVETLIQTGARVCIFDPLGVWWGLRAGPDGNPKGGLSVIIFGGLHADVPITEHDGAALAHIIAGAFVQCIVDVSEIGSGAARQRFMLGFMQALYETNREPLHFVLDEADMLAPQTLGKDDGVGPKLLGLTEQIVRRGRVRGFVPWLITQRPAVLNKNVLSQADVLIAMKLTSSQDRKAIEAWITGQADEGEGRRILADLPKLHRGSGYIWAPGHGILERVAFPAIATFDSSRTPKRGETINAAALAPVDVVAITASLAQQRAPAKETRLSHDAIEQARTDGHEAARREVDADLVALRDQVRRMQAGINAALGHLAAFIERPPDGVPVVEVRRPPEPKMIEARPVRAPREPRKPNGSAGLHSAARAILGVLASRAPAWLTWTQAATLAGLKARGGHFNAGRQQLRGDGLIVEDGALIQAAPAGIVLGGDVPPAPTTPAAVRAMWCAKLPPPAPEMIGILAERGPLMAAEMAELLGKQPRGGHWNSGIAVLRNNGLIVTVGRGEIRLAEELAG
jgi:hypothetical protein